jgi:hypothetical protein
MTVRAKTNERTTIVPLFVAGTHNIPSTVLERKIVLLFIAP